MKNIRTSESINNFLKLVDWKLLLSKRWNIKYDINSTFIDSLYKNTWNIQYWKENSDQRIGQVLINVGLIPRVQSHEFNIYKFMSCHIWYDEENDILTAQGLPIKNIYSKSLI